MLDASLAALDVCRVEIGAFLEVLAHALLKEEFIHTALELREILALCAFPCDHLQAVEIAVYDHECGHAHEAHLDSMGIMTNKAVNEIFGQPGDAIERGDRDGERHKHAPGPMAAFRSDEFLIDPASYAQAFLHRMEVFAPSSRDFSGILRIKNHKRAPKSQTSARWEREHSAVVLKICVI